MWYWIMEKQQNYLYYCLNIPVSSFQPPLSEDYYVDVILIQSDSTHFISMLTSEYELVSTIHNLFPIRSIYRLSSEIELCGPL